MLDPIVQQEYIRTGRDFMKGERKGDPREAFESDQERKLPQPPLVKAPVTPKENWIALPMDFETLNLKNDVISLIRDRRSSRVYTQENMTLKELSFLLWATQGIKSIRGKSYATIRTVPCGGARHQYETYLMLRKVDDLQPGVYHYLPMEHALEYLHSVDNLEEEITDSLCGQSWGAKANVIFYWTVDAYRVEWRYGVYAHRPALMDAGHIGQNLYLGCTALGLGCCGIASFDHDVCNRLFGLDGENEFAVYTAPVGTVREQDLAEEKLFYKFVDDEGL